MREARVCSHDGSMRRRKRGHILTMDQSDTGSAGMFSRRTNHLRKRGYVLTTDQSDAGSACYGKRPSGFSMNQ
eukprot:2005904-Pyramimonas_sp.AAC.1